MVAGIHAALLAIGGLALGLAAGFVLGTSRTWKQVPLSRDDCRRLGNDAVLAEQVQKVLHPPATPQRPSGVPVRLLALLQRSGRFLDFALENFAGAADSQVAAAIRDLHPKWQETLKKHITFEPVIPQEEGTETTVPAGFDPSAIQLVGNVSGNPPFKGTVRHPGWRVKQISIPELPKGQDDLVVMPAEVEIA
jgi:hypothetical protein